LKQRHCPTHFHLKPEAFDCPLFATELAYVTELAEQTIRSEDDLDLTLVLRMSARNSVTGDTKLFYQNKKLVYQTSQTV